jgi:hypothetical protein
MGAAPRSASTSEVSLRTPLRIYAPPFPNSKPAQLIRQMALTSSRSWWWEWAATSPFPGQRAVLNPFSVPQAHTGGIHAHRLTLYSFLAGRSCTKARLQNLLMIGSKDGYHK